ncbi:Na/Pi symporter [Salsipaludibacter albus]|uniref:Na/Pi symporter n=1 Tax=Salsipaludibacter albus TaxID=2849650 RepID=UPI001EE4C1DB
MHDRTSVPPAMRSADPGLPTWLRGVLVGFLLYGFLVGVSLLESGIETFGSGFQDGLIESVSNPIAGLCAGILTTVLVQSSSVSTATIVGLVGSGTLSVEAAVPMVMGANIGTTVTNTLASLGHVRRVDEFRRAFAGATVHDVFNVMAVALLLPLELATGILSRAATSLADVLVGMGVQGGSTSSPVKQAVGAPADALTDLLSRVLSGIPLAIVLVVLALSIVFVCLTFITRNMRQLVAARVESAMNRLIGRGGGIMGIVVGLVVTVLVQSSSITTSILVPLLGAGVLTLANAFPITLGANVGTTVTALLASLAVDQEAGLVIALVHTLFNIAGILLIYPVERVRRLPLGTAEWLAKEAVDHRSMIVAYIIGLFVVLPTLGLVLL